MSVFGWKGLFEDRCYLRADLLGRRWGLPSMRGPALSPVQPCACWSWAERLGHDALLTFSLSVRSV